MTEPNTELQTTESTKALQTARRARLIARRRLTVVFPGFCLFAFLGVSFASEYIPSASMTPTLKPGDHIITMRSWLAYPYSALPERGDIVVFRLSYAQMESGYEPADEQTNQMESGIIYAGSGEPPAQQTAKYEILIKRVVALPGDTVWVTHNEVFVNGRALDEDYGTVNDDPMNVGLYTYAVEAPYLVPEDTLFLLGDNRKNSEDSRFYGPVRRKDVLGKFVTVLFNEGNHGPNEIRARNDSRSDSR